jgi:hypothetical protein
MATTDDPAVAGTPPPGGDAEPKTDDTGSAILGFLIWVVIIGLVIRPSAATPQNRCSC